MRVFSTPMMQQYADIKQQYKDCLLFFRLGDFYELFLDDAKIGADILDITLTKRPRGKDGYIPMAGVPHHVADLYISRLVKAGHKVAICEQISEPDGRGIVERKVIRIVTPGTLMDENSLDKKNHNYTISISMDNENIGLAAADITTGDFQATQIPFGKHLDHLLLTEVTRFNPKECILSEKMYANFTLLKILSSQKNLNMSSFSNWETFAEDAERFLKKHFGLSSLNSFGIEDKVHALKASASLLGYLQETQKNEVLHIGTIRAYTPDESVILDRSTIKNLEIFTTIHEGKKKDTFINTIDHTKSAIGARKLREWVKEPLIKKNEIEKRLDATQELLKKEELREKIQELLMQIYDLERVISRLSVGVGNPVDVIHLSESLTTSLFIKEKVAKLKSKYFSELTKSISPKLNTLINFIEAHIVEDPPFDPRNGNLIKSGVDKKLDSLKQSISESKNWIESLETKERKRTGISNLKVKFNKVFGFYIEVSNANKNKVPQNYIRKQTIVNAERFITDELKKHEDAVLNAEEKIKNRELEIFEGCIKEILKYTSFIQTAANSISIVDCLSSFAEVSSKNSYIRPKINTKGIIDIKEGRHPVVEDNLGDEFVPNNTYLDNGGNQMLIITGPNMAGKSVYMRQVALITLMAHIGMFVPANSADISIVDRIFARSGASDVITSGLSTFMLEMVETAHILNHATDKSLIVMDEVGRGTSTYDGISIAWAIASYLIETNEKKAKTLFATHYHELTKLENEYPKSAKNYHMAVEDKKGKPVFLYTLVEGGASASYGVAVANMAGVPEKVTQKALSRLSHLENDKEKVTEVFTEKEKDLLDELKVINLNDTTPLSALNILSKLQRKYADK